MRNKVVIITGGTSGIGSACAAVFGKAGYCPVITGRNEDSLQKMSSRLTQLAIDHLALQADVSVEKENKAVIQKIIQQFGKIDMLINNAGITMRALFETLDLAVFKKVMDINFYGAVYATKYCLPYILQSKGSIVGISSINGYRGTPARTAYTASKYAMNGFFEALRTEVMHSGVHVLVVSPGFTASNIRKNALTADGSIQKVSPRDENKLMSPEAVACAILKAVKKRKRDLILTTQGKLAVFLNKWIPAYMDKITYNYMAKEPDNPLQ